MRCAAQLGNAAQLSFAAADPAFERKGLKTWDFGELPESLALTRHGNRVTGYPALVDTGDAAALALLDTAAAAAEASRAGVLRLLHIALRDAIARYDKGGPGFAQAALQLKAAIPTDRLLEDVRATAVERALLADDPLPRNERAFAELVKRARARLPAVTEGAFRQLGTIAAEHLALTQRLAALPPGLGRVGRRGACAARRAGVSRDSSVARRGRTSPICRATSRRWTGAWPSIRNGPTATAGTPNRWRRGGGATRSGRTRRPTAGRPEAALEDFRWLLEELRVSLFAQELRTPHPVSFKRLDKAWAELGRRAGGGSAAVGRPARTRWHRRVGVLQ